jgi:hypothetical protein
MIGKQLINLLNMNRSNPIVADCLERIAEASEVRLQDNTSAPLNQIIDIYSRRARINSKLNAGIVEGFDDFLPSLKAISTESVKMHSLEFLSHWYEIFTDESTSLLYGILKSPKKKAAWFDSNRGYDG